MTVLPASLACVAVLLGTSAAATVLARREAARVLVYGAALAATGILLGMALTHVGAEADAMLTLPLGLPWLGAHFRLDPLSAFFLAVVSLGGTAASLYGLGYGRDEKAPQRILPFFPAFLAGMTLVVLADDAFTFLVAWEFMSLASWALVMAHHREHGNAHAGYVYLVMAAFGTLALLLAFGLMAGPDGGYTFAEMRAAHAGPLVAGLVLGAVLLGAGSKSGLVPLHAWLPLAHPAAPSHVSALMSGVMTKVAVYAFIRVTFDLLGSPAWWWSLVVLALGALTCVLGVLYALMQHDLKRLLAYHTVENIGIVFVGLGLALAFRAADQGWAAALALTAALFHVLNHSVFKGLLFLGSGAVLAATGQRDMEHLGGLIHRMPWTALTFLIGAAAISALPPLNGFVSEWLVFQAVLVSPGLPDWGARFLVPAVGAVLALSAALAAACFVKAFGITFLGRPRSAVAEHAREAGWLMRVPMAGLAALCVLAGVLPGMVIDALGPVVQGLVGSRMPLQAGQPWLSIVPVTEVRASYNGMAVLLFVSGAAMLAAFAIHRLATRGVRRAPAWDCGFPDPSHATQYTAGSFAQPIRRVFGTLVFRAAEEVDMPPPGDTRAARLHLRLRDLIWEGLYLPVATGVLKVADLLNRYQFLTIRRYLSVVFGLLILLLLALALWT